MGGPCGFAGAEMWAPWQSSLGVTRVADPPGRKGRMPRVAADLPPPLCGFYFYRGRCLGPEVFDLRDPQEYWEWGVFERACVCIALLP